MRFKLKRLFWVFFSCFSSSARCKYELHDYVDSADGLPEHFVTKQCVRCGKKLTI